jgi:hypothetical protein
MKDKKRRGDARRLAEEYAPRPISSYLMYGIVGVSLAGLGLYAFANFYDVDPLAYPLWIALSLVAVFAGSIGLRMARTRRHEAAHRREYNKLGPR